MSRVIEEKEEGMRILLSHISLLLEDFNLFSPTVNLRIRILDSGLIVRTVVRIYFEQVRYWVAKPVRLNSLDLQVFCIVRIVI
jgi:hypothetical protein